jgi:hypothetical protein
VAPGKGKGRAGGAFGKSSQANRNTGNTSGEGGGGGGATPGRDLPRVVASTKAAGKRT